MDRRMDQRRQYCDAESWRHIENLWSVISKRFYICRSAHVKIADRYKTVPTLADIRLKLTESESYQGNLSGIASVLTEGLAIERAQYVTICYMS